EAWKRKHRRRGVEGRERWLVDVTEVADSGLGLDPLERVAVCPSGAARDHELGHAEPALDDGGDGAAGPVAKAGEEGGVVLAWLDAADGEDEAWLDTFGQRAGLGRAGKALRDDVNAALQARARVEAEQVSARRVRGHDDRARLA